MWLTLTDLGVCMQTTPTKQTCKHQVEAQPDYGPGSEIGTGWKIGVTWSRKRSFKMAAVELGYLLTKSSFWPSLWHNISILAPKLTSHACAPQVCSPPAAIAVTPAISQTSMCKALRIDSSWHAHINEHCHETWSFCLIYCILSKSSEIFRQMGCIYQLQHFLLDQITDGRWPGN